MAPHEATKILLESMAVPDYARLEYFKNQQQASGYSMSVFVRFLTDALTPLSEIFVSGWVDSRGQHRPPVENWPIITHLGYVPATGPTMITIDHLQQLGATLQGLVDTMQQAVKKRMAESKPKHQPSEREREAMYLFYMGTFPKKGEALYKETLDWAKDSTRLHSNGSKKSRNSKKDHMEAVLKRVLSEKKPGWENRRDRIQQDIKTLLDNFQ